MARGDPNSDEEYERRRAYNVMAREAHETAQVKCQSMINENTCKTWSHDIKHGHNIRNFPISNMV